MITKRGYERERTQLELYFHIPFCVKKCAYCDFLSAQADEETKKAYMKRLMEDMEQFPDKDKYFVTSVFIGGGTPTVVEADEIKKLLELAKCSFSFAQDAEITIEANPGTIKADSLRLYREAGINRISFGLQSVHDGELEKLGRIHSYEAFLESFQMAREAGFTNINVDLMFGLPGQSPESWRQTLHEVAGLGVEHISAYSLIIEEGTPFFSAYQKDLERRERGELPKLLPSEEAEARMYSDGVRILKDYGYEQYEISNFAKEGFSCRHNEGYWTGADYAGFGLGAASYINKARYTRTTNRTAYLNGDFSELERQTLSLEEQMEEFMILGLRRTKGISKTDFKERFNRELPDAYRKVIDKYKKNGLLEEDGESIFFTKKGVRVSNLVLSEFLNEL